MSTPAWLLRLKCHFFIVPLSVLKLTIVSWLISSCLPPNGTASYHGLLAPSWDAGASPYFQDLAPLWSIIHAHGGREPSRTRTCSLRALYFLGIAVEDHTWPLPEQRWWRTHSSSLVAAITSLLSSCRRQGFPLFSSSFSTSLPLIWFIL